MDEAASAFRRLASSLMVHAHAIPPKARAVWRRSLPTPKELEDAHHALIGLSNGIHRGISDHNLKGRAVIINSLRLTLKMVD